MQVSTRKHVTTHARTHTAAERTHIHSGKDYLLTLNADQVMALTHIEQGS